MLAWLWNLFVGNFCVHKWEKKAECDVYGVDPYDYRETTYPTYRVYKLRCTKCGNWKNFKTR